MAARRIVAEIGSCGGDLALAIDTAQAAVDAGAWMVKGQMYQAATLVTRTAPVYGHGSIVEPATQWEAFENALTYEEWHRVADAVDGRFFASVFDLAACDGYPYEWIKVASADITYRDLIVAAASTGKRLIMSTGAAAMGEIRRALSWIPGVPVTLMACTLSYPTEPSDANVRRVTSLRDFRHVDVGYSDHTRGTAAAHLAFDLGASMVEKHFTIRPGTGGDHDFAIGPDDVRQIVERKDPVSDAVAMVFGGSDVLGARVCELAALKNARRSLHATVDIPAGSILTRHMLTAIRPVEGAPAWHLDDYLGKRVTCDIAAGAPITTTCVS